MSNVKKAMDIHDKAMEFCEEAQILSYRKMLGEKVPDNVEQEISKNIKKAFELEKEAAMTLIDEKECPVTRAVLFRSAAVLGMDCKEYAESKKLVDLGLTGKVPPMIKLELRELEEELSSITF